MLLRRIALAAALCVAPLLPARVAPAEELQLPAILKQDAAVKTVIPVFTLKGELSEAPADETLALFGEKGTSLQQLTKRMKQAATDADVRAVVVLDDGGTFGFAQLEELRQAMAQLRAAGKEVYVNADSLTFGKYILFSGATRISVVPTADIWVTGMFAEQPYVRGLLDKISVTPDFLHCGPYKSAAEMFMRTGPSKEADEMTNWLLDGIYKTAIDLMAKGRSVTPEKAKGWIDGGPYTAEKAKEAGLIDAVEHRQQFEQMLTSKYGQGLTFDHKYGTKQKSQMDFSSPLAVFKIWGDMIAGAQKPGSTKSAVGIVYVEGAIGLGSSTPSPFGGSTGAMSSDIRKALDKAADDDTIKAVVLRVNSPGGSAVASEIILDGTKRVKAKKPLVVSMGNVAGSGGYYVACASDTIFADEATITGSIGVVGGKLVTTEMWNRVGVTFKPYQRGANAGMLSSGQVFSAQERERMQAWMDDIYGVFKGHVTAIRGKKLTKPIDELAGGRVYTGRQALDLGLVDKLGTLSDAVAFAANEANLGDYDVRVVPEPKNFIEQLLEELTGGGKDENSLVRMPTSSLWDLALPHLTGLDPQRMAAIREAFIQLKTLDREGVILMTPPIVMPN